MVLIKAEVAYPQRSRCLYQQPLYRGFPTRRTAYNSHLYYVTFTIHTTIALARILPPPPTTASAAIVGGEEEERTERFVSYSETVSVVRSDVVTSVGL